MNLIDAVVTKIIGLPEFKYNSWFVKVEYEAYGRPGESQLLFKTKDEADNVKIGDVFQT